MHTELCTAVCRQYQNRHVFVIRNHWEPEGSLHVGNKVSLNVIPLPEKHTSEAVCPT